MTQQEAEKLAHRICTKKGVRFLSVEYYSSCVLPLWITVEDGTGRHELKCHPCEAD